jgi:hypothetical protein
MWTWTDAGRPAMIEPSPVSHDGHRGSACDNEKASDRVSITSVKRPWLTFRGLRMCKKFGCRSMFIPYVHTTYEQLHELTRTGAEIKSEKKATPETAKSTLELNRPKMCMCVWTFYMCIYHHVHVCYQEVFIFESMVR